MEMNIRILGVAASVLSIVAAWAYWRLNGKWRRIMLLVGAVSTMSSAMIVGDATRSEASQGRVEQSKDVGIDVGEMWLTEYRRLKNGEKDEAEVSRGIREGREELPRMSGDIRQGDF